MFQVVPGTSTYIVRGTSRSTWYERITRLLHELDELRGVPGPLIVLDELLHVVGVLEDVQAANARQPELLSAHAGVANLSHRARQAETRKNTERTKTHGDNETYDRYGIMRHTVDMGQRISYKG